jgi:hypothetical protein
MSSKQNKLFDMNSDIKNNTLTIQIQDCTLLNEEDLDNINKAIFDNLTPLNPKKDLYIKLLNEVPVIVWVYLSTLVKYIDKTLTIYTIENKENISDFLEAERLIIIHI